MENQELFEPGVLFDKARELGAVELVAVEAPDGRKAVLASVPKGRTLQDVSDRFDAFADHPKRPTGTHQVSSLASFLKVVERFEVPGRSVVFADPTGPSMTAIFDWHGDQPGFLRHKAEYEFPLSDEWKVWTKKNGFRFGQQDFAEFLEDRIFDVMDAPDLDAGTSKKADDVLAELSRKLGGAKFATVQELLTLSRGLEVHVKSTVSQHNKLQSGEGEILFKSEHRDQQGGKLVVPNLFLIAIPVFLEGAKYRIPARLRYRVGQAGVEWFYDLHGLDRIFKAAFDEAVHEVEGEVKSTVLRGSGTATAV